MLNLQNSIIFEWNRPIQKQINIKIEPSISYTTSVEGGKLTINPTTDLVNNTKYTVTVSNIKQENSDQFEEDFRLSFTAAIIAFDKLSKEQQEEIIKDVDEQYKKYPILGILPTQHPDFAIESQYIKNELYIVITPAVLANGLTEEEYTTTYASYLQEGKDYLTDRGYKLEDYNVVSDQEFLALQQSNPN